MAFQLRRGTSAQRTTITPLQGELLYTTDTKALYVGDGTTAGGTVVGGGGGGASALNDLTDVVIAGTPTTGQVLKYDGANWVNGTDAGGGATTLDSLTDVVIAGTPTTGQVLKYDGTNWVNGTDAGGGTGATYTISAEADLIGAALRLTGSDLTTDEIVFAEGTNITISRTDANTITIDAATVTENDVLDFVGPWLETGTNTGISFTYNPITRAITTAVSQALGDISDVNLLIPPNDDDVLKYDAIAGEWVAGTALVVDDPNPRLGAPLDLNGQTINGVGTISLTGQLDVDGAVVIGGPTNYLGGLSIVSQSSNTVTDPILTIANYSGAGVIPLANFLKARGTADSPLSTALGDILGGFRFGGLGSNISAIPDAAAAIFSVADPTGTVGTNFVTGALIFQVRNTAGTLASAMTINQDGIVKYPLASTVLPAVVDTSAAVSYLKVRVQNGPTPVDLYMPLFAAL